jgi:hypothetical protein
MQKQRSYTEELHMKHAWYRTIFQVVLIKFNFSPNIL